MWQWGQGHATGLSLPLGTPESRGLVAGPLRNVLDRHPRENRMLTGKFQATKITHCTRDTQSETTDATKKKAECEEKAIRTPSREGAL